MSVYSSEKNAFKPSKKLPSPVRSPGFSKKKGLEVFVGNLPRDITEMEIVDLFKDFGLKAIRRQRNSSGKSFAFLEMASPEAVRVAVHVRNGYVVKGQRMIVAISEDRRSLESRKNHTETLQMPDLEPVHNGLPVNNGVLVPKPSTQTVPPSKKNNVYAIPVEMRSSFLVQMLRDCFKNVGWLFPVSIISGDVALLVTDTVPQTPFFWAIHLTEESHQNMQKLFSALAEVESQMPFLTKEEVQRGTRCMAECILGEEGAAWNRCWVLDKVENLAVVFFMDFGCSATVPLNALRRLDKNDLWAIKPLAQPFVLDEDVFPPQNMVRQILEGRIIGPSQKEVHILRFTIKTK